MTISGKDRAWKDMSHAEREAAEQAFGMLSQYDSLTRAMYEDDGGVSLGFADIYHYATDPQADLDPVQRRLLARDAKLQDALDRLLAKNTIYQFPRVAAASSGDVTEREGDGFKVKLKESRADAGQVYIILTLDDHIEAQPASLVVKGEGGLYLKQSLPEIDGGVVQMLEPSDAEIVRALRDVKTELYLL